MSSQQDQNSKIKYMTDLGNLGERLAGALGYVGEENSHRGDAGLNEGLVGEYRGEVGLKDGDWGLYRGEVGENDGEVGE